MTGVHNLLSRIEKQLPADVVSLMRKAGELAAGQGKQLYFVGGVVRDLLLGQTSFDIDLVIEGDAIDLAQHLASIKPGRLVTHPRFGTAKLQWGKWSIDLVTARSESYARPGALPTVKPGSIHSDLFRRDFTINAMAIRLNPERCGELFDPYGGKADLEHKLVRVLHEKSFIDDATRIWRGLRYEQRLDFQLKSTTLKLLKRDIPMLDTISAERVRYEVECILRERLPEKILRRASELKVLPKLHPALKGNGWLADKFSEARRISSPSPPPIGLYLSLMGYHLSLEQIEDLLSRLRLPRSIVGILRDTANLKSRLLSLEDAQLAPSRVYYLLHGYSPQAIIANLLACHSSAASQHLSLFLYRLRYVRPSLTGDDLVKMGVTSGPDVGSLLRQIHEGRLDGRITDKQGELSLVKDWITRKTDSR